MTIQKLNQKGIYLLKNIKTGNSYIGSTRVNFLYRLGLHFNKLYENTHENKFIQEDYNLYGKESFEFEILKVLDGALTQKEFNDIEKTFIKKLNPNYNIVNGVGNSGMFKKGHQSWNKGKELPDWVKEKLSEAAKRRKYSEDGKFKRKEAIRKKSKPVLIKKEDKEMYIFRSSMDIQEYFNNKYLSGNIQKAIKLKRPYKDLIFEYCDKDKAPNISDDICIKLDELRESLEVDNPEPSLT